MKRKGSSQVDDLIEHFNQTDPNWRDKHSPMTYNLVHNYLPPPNPRIGDRWIDSEDPSNQTREWNGIAWILVQGNSGRSCFYSGPKNNSDTGICPDDLDFYLFELWLNQASPDELDKYAKLKGNYKISRELVASLTKEEPKKLPQAKSDGVPSWSELDQQVKQAQKEYDAEKKLFDKMIKEAYEDMYQDHMEECLEEIKMQQLVNIRFEHDHKYSREQ